MTAEIAFVFAVVAVATVLFVTERFRIDEVAIAIPIVLLAGGAIDLEGASAGLAHPATLTVAAMLMLSLGLVKTGAVGAIGDWATRAPLASGSARILALCIFVALISPFVNNTAVVAAFLPVFLAVARHVDESPSRVLMPLSFAAILGGTLTMIGTSTNLIVYGMARARGFDELTMFSIAPLGAACALVGFVYLFSLGRRLLPERTGAPDLAAAIGERSFVTELEVGPESPVAGTDLQSLEGLGEEGVALLAIRRGRRTLSPPSGAWRLEEGDILLVRGQVEDILKLADAANLVTRAARLRSEVDEADGSAGEPDGADGADGGIALLESGRLVELLISPGSPFVGSSLRRLRFGQRFGATVLAIQRPGTEVVTRRMHDLRLRVGDLLLVHGSAGALEDLADVPGLVVLGEVQPPVVGRPRSLVAVAIMGAVVAVAGVGLVPIVAAAFGGVVLMIYTGCVRLDEIYDELDWTVVVLLAGLLPLGLAMDETGAAEWIGLRMAAVIGDAHPTVVVGAFYLVASLLTEAMSNNAAAAVLTPIALGTAASLDTSPYALLVAVMFGASASFMTPVGYQTNTLIYGPGGYRFSDFLRVGAPLNLLLLIVASLLIPVLWPG